MKKINKKNEFIFSFCIVFYYKELNNKAFACETVITMLQPL